MKEDKEVQRRAARKYEVTIGTLHKSRYKVTQQQDHVPVLQTTDETAAFMSSVRVEGVSGRSAAKLLFPVMLVGKSYDKVKTGTSCLMLNRRTSSLARPMLRN